MVLKFVIVILVVLFLNLKCDGNARRIVATQRKDMTVNTFDCIDVNKQPTLDHPLLKNYKVQMEPTNLPKGALDGVTSQIKLPLSSVNCPKGTVPIQRTKQLMISAKKFTNIGPLRLSPGGTAVYLNTTSNDKLMFGAKAKMSLLNSPMEGDQAVFSTISLTNYDASNGNANHILAGWTISPDRYGDSKTRFIIYWQTLVDGTLAGCFNDDCPGFMHVNKDFPLNQDFPEVSSYGKDSIIIEIAIVQDQSTKDWWLTIPSGSIKVGYWPSALFPRLKGGANQILWGGNAIKNSAGKSPPMGFGKFPDEDGNHSGNFKDCHIFDGEGKESVPTDSMLFEENDKCYKIIQGSLSPYSFINGGPGGENC